MNAAWVYIQSEAGLWTVGFYDPSGKWQPESDHGSREEAANRVHWLNGGEEIKEQTECERHECTYYKHYLLWWKPETNGPKLEHEAYHEAERRCTEAQNRLSDWMDTHDGDPKMLAAHLWGQAEMWERKVCA